MRVLIAGGGIGGLTLAQGLRRRGVEVRVLERDSDLSLTGGYRLHLDPTAGEVLGRELPRASWTELESCSAGGEAFRAMHVVDRRLRLLGRVPVEGDGHRLIGRRPLRQVLAEGLGTTLVLDQVVTGFTRTGDGGVLVESRARSTGRVEQWTADLLVAADGVGSVVAAQAAGRGTSTPLGLAGLAGRVDDLAAHEEGAPAYLRDGPALAIGPRGLAMFVTRHAVGTAREPDGWVWGLIMARSAAGSSRTSLDEARSLLRHWSPWAQRLVASTPADHLGHYRFHAADARGELFGWEPGPVTALGDAVHAMPPTGGQSASTAVADAGDLLEAVATVCRGERSLPAAMATYQSAVARRARPRIRESLGPARWVQRTRGPVGSAALLSAAGLLRTSRRLVGRPSDGPTGRAVAR